MRPNTTIFRRLDAVEQGLSPLQRAHMLVRRAVPPARWPDEVLNAYVAEHCQELALLSDEELGWLIAAPPGQVDAMLERFLEARGYARR